MSNENLIPLLKDQCEVSQTQSVYSAYDIYLDEEIKDPTYYRQAFQVLRSAQKGDLVRLYISSPGGNLNSAVIFKNCIEDCQADVIAIIEAEAYSAASLIALSCANIEVKPYATMMCHSAAFGAGGIVQNVRDHVDFTGRHAETIMEEVYQDFLDSSELEDIRRGREIWLDYHQIGERLDKMFEARQNRPCSCGNCAIDKEGDGNYIDDEEQSQSFDLKDMIKEAVREALLEQQESEAKEQQKPVKSPRTKKAPEEQKIT